jgi:hypothetical protein
LLAFILGHGLERVDHIQDTLISRSIKTTGKVVHEMLLAGITDSEMLDLVLLTSVPRRIQEVTNSESLQCARVRGLK